MGSILESVASLFSNQTMIPEVEAVFAASKVSYGALGFVCCCLAGCICQPLHDVCCRLTGRDRRVCPGQCVDNSPLLNQNIPFMLSPMFYLHRALSRSRSTSRGHGKPSRQMLPG